MMWLWIEQQEECIWIRSHFLEDVFWETVAWMQEQALWSKCQRGGGLFQTVGLEVFLFVDGTQRAKFWHKWCWLKRCLSPSLWWWLCWLCLGQRGLCVMPGSMGFFTMLGSVGLFVSHLGQWGYIMPGSWVRGSCCSMHGSAGLYY